MNLSDISFNETSYAVPSGPPGVEYLSPPTTQTDTFSEEEAKTAVFPVRLTMPDIPFIVPEQELEVTVQGDLSRARTLQKDLWPIISFEILTDSSGVANFRSLGISPAGNSAPGLLFFSRYNYFLSQAQQLTIAFPSINKEFLITFSLDEVVWRQVLYFAALARKLRFIENFFGKTFTLPNEISRTELLFIELLYRGITEGEFTLIVPQISSLWDPPAQSVLSKPPFTGPGPFTASCKSGKIDLFGQQLKIGPIEVELKNAKVVDTAVIEQIRQKPNRPVHIDFALLDGRATFRFEKYLQELTRDKRGITQKIANFKDGLSRKFSEPDGLINSINLPLIGEPPPGAMPPFPGIKFPPPQQEQVTSTVDASLSIITSQLIAIPHLDEVRNYLLQHLDLTELLLSLCKSARAAFEEETELSLELYKDPELDDEYLTLYVRQPVYNKETLDRIESLSSEYEQEMASRSGWLLLTADFRARDQETVFDWKEYHKLARYLHDQSESGFIKEAAERSSASRSYYAALCQVRKSGRAGNHRLLREDLKSRKEVRVAAHLDRLKQWRDLCDYNDRVNNLSILAGFAIDEAERVLGLLTES